MIDKQRLVNDVLEIVRENAISEQSISKIDKILVRGLVDKGYDLLYNVRVLDENIDIIVRLDDDFFPIECKGVRVEASLNKVKNLWRAINHFRDISSGYVLLLGESREFTRVSEKMVPKKLNEHFFCWGGKIIQSQDEPALNAIRETWNRQKIQMLINE